MQRIFNKDGFNWWIGCVEDRLDPEKMGRCKVRIFGYHTDNKTLLPTKDLPWCVPIQPITSAAISGIGSSPLGPVEGTWVIGFFLDGEDMQQPAMFGTIATRSLGGFEGVKEGELLNNPNDGIQRDAGGRPVLDDQGNPVRNGTPAVEGWELGQTSESFESGGRGPGTINNYPISGDAGGASYGIYQFASYLPQRNPVTGASRPSSKNSPVIQFINQSKFKEMFAGLEPATSAFDSKWVEIANKFKKDFEAEQHDFVKRNYYNVMVANLQRQGFNLSNYGPGVQDLIWSTAVQFGPARTTIFTEPLKGKSTLTDTDIINLVSEYKKKNVNVFFKSSGSNIQQSQFNRFASEQSALLKLVTA